MATLRENCLGGIGVCACFIETAAYLAISSPVSMPRLHMLAYAAICGCPSEYQLSSHLCLCQVDGL